MHQEVVTNHTLDINCNLLKLSVDTQDHPWYLQWSACQLLIPAQNITKNETLRITILLLFFQKLQLKVVWSLIEFQFMCGLMHFKMNILIKTLTGSVRRAKLQLSYRVSPSGVMNTG